MDFSFSGLKTAVARHVRQRQASGLGPLSTTELADICASFQRAVVEALLDRAFEAARRFGARSLGIAGGVSANSRLREVVFVAMIFDFGVRTSSSNRVLVCRTLQGVAGLTGLAHAVGVMYRELI